MLKLYFFLLVLLLMANFVDAQTSEQIKINQVGYYPNAIKIAIITGNAEAKKFYITSIERRDTVYTGFLGAPRHSDYSTTITRSADFTSFNKKGSYRLIVPGIGSSYIFKINDHVYKALNKAVIKSYYFQRSGIELEKQYAGKWNRKKGHPDTSVLIHPSAATTARPSLSSISSPGGWYDAGDYNKYIVNSGITMGTLFSAFEDFPAYLKTLSINIPETDNQLPDILDEALYNLRWMLTMQDPNDGGVYHKLTNAFFDPMIMPDAAVKTRYVVQKTTAATLDFTAVMAQAARILARYHNQLPLLADSCKMAAIKAWQWALVNKSVIYDQDEMNKHFQPSITTGAYGGTELNDEWMWAAAELFITTREKSYLAIVKEHMNLKLQLPSWNNVAMLAYYSLIRFQDVVNKTDRNIIGLMKDSLISYADKLISNVPLNAFSTVMGQSKNDFIWGSNSVAANQGILLINVYLITKDKKYINGALGNLDYLLGRNATGYCFVTGAGTKSPMNPHHRISVADGITEPVPGLLVGGPNPGQQDKCTYQFFEPETSYSDTSCAYASNEVAINWNAPMVYLVSAIEALEK